MSFINNLKTFFSPTDLGLMLFRILIGLTMAFAHGWGKIPPPEQLITGVGSMGFPAPVLFAWAAALSEFLGALLITAGLFTRLSSVLLGFTMGVAFFVVHGADAFQVKELSFMYLASCVLLVFTGAGKYSLDQIFRKS